MAQVLVQAPEFWLRVSQDPVRVLSACHLHALSARLRSLHSSSAGCCFASAFALHSCLHVWLLLGSRSWFKLSSSRGRIRLSSCHGRSPSRDRCRRSLSLRALSAYLLFTCVCPHLGENERNFILFCSSVSHIFSLSSTAFLLPLPVFWGALEQDGTVAMLARVGSNDRIASRLMLRGVYTTTIIH